MIRGSRAPRTWVFGCMLCLLLSRCLIAQDSGVALNLLPDPSFEVTTPVAAGWKPRAWQGAAHARWSVESPGHLGKRCLCIRSDKGTDAAWTAVVNVKPNAFYRLSGWIKTSNLSGAVGALLNIQNLQHVRTPRITGTRTWTRVSTTFWSGATTALEINCLFGGWGQSTGQAWYDELALEWIADASQPLQGCVTIDTNGPRAAYSRMLFGGFIEHFSHQIYGGLFEPGSPLADEKGFRKDVIAALKELKLSIVRWPGGCFASGYHWKDGVGKDRKPVRDPVWGGEDPNSFGTDEFVEFCRRVGCQPYICTNAGNGTPGEMAEWVNYCKQTAAGVRFWSIGNENWGAHEIGARTPHEWGPLVLRSARLMRAADPGIQLLAAATPNRDWTLPLLKTAGKELGYVAIHQYWIPCWGQNLTPDYQSCITLSEEPETTIAQVVDLLEQSGCRGRIKIAFDEWNLRGWHHPGFPRKQPSDQNDKAAAELIQAREKNAIASQYTMADALFSASFLNACLRHADDVGMANIAPIVNTRGPLYVHPRGIVKRTTFHVLAMYANLLGEKVSRAEVASTPLQHAGRTVSALDALATCDAGGRKWRIVLINRDPGKKLHCTLKLGGKLLDGNYRATILSGDSPSAYNDVDHPDRVVPRKVGLSISAGQLTLLPHSLTVIEADATAGSRWGAGDRDPGRHPSRRWVRFREPADPSRLARSRGPGARNR